MYNLVQPDDSLHHHSFTRKPRRRNYTFTLRLTSMIDIFTILLIFLLKNYSTEGQIMTTPKEINLPVSTATKVPSGSSIILISSEWIMVDGRPLESMNKITSDKKLLLNNLYEDLKAKRILAESVAKLDDRMAFRGEITVQGDENIPFLILKRVMYTCGQVGYNNILLAVTSNAE